MRVLDVTQIMEYPHLLEPQILTAALPPPQYLMGMVLHGIVDLSSRSCHAAISSGAPRTRIRPGFARGMGFLSVPQYGDYTQRSDGAWYRIIEHHHPGLRLRVSGFHWVVRAIEAETGPYDLILGADWLHEHRVIVDIYGRSISLQAPGGRLFLRFLGHPAVLEIIDAIPHPPVAPDAPVAPAAPVVPPEPVIDLEEEPEEEDPAGPVVGDAPVGNGFVAMDDDEGGITDIEVD